MASASGPLGSRGRPSGGSGGFRRTSPGRSRVAVAGRKRSAVWLGCIARCRTRGAKFLHKLTTDLTREYDCTCLEDLNTKGLAKTKPSRSVLDAAFGEFVRQVEYKATWSFKHSVRVGRFFPSTKLCSECGKVNVNVTLSDRTWLCERGTQHDRDLNAARNILAEGMRLLAAGQTESQNARGEPVNLPRGSTAR